MRISDFQNYKISFQEEMHSFQHGQKDLSLNAFVNNEKVGYIDYSEYDGTPAIKYIEVFDKNKGIGKALIKKLQTMYPDKEIEWGNLTSDGMMLKNSLPTKTVYNPKYQEYLSKLERLKQLEDSYTKIIENKNTTTEKRLELGVKWNQLHDLEYQLKEKLKNLSQSKTLIITD
jgi:hypothetical protein